MRKKKDDVLGQIHGHMMTMIKIELGRRMVAKNSKKI